MTKSFGGKIRNKSSLAENDHTLYQSPQSNDEKYYYVPMDATLDQLSRNNQLFLTNKNSNSILLKEYNKRNFHSNKQAMKDISFLT